MFEYQNLLANAPVGICVLKNRKLTFCNQRFEEIFGYNSGELNDQSVQILYPSIEMFKHIGLKYGHFFEKNVHYRDERPAIRKDGSMIWCVVTGRSLDSANPRLGQIWVVQDISEHKRIEEHLKEDVEKLELMVQQRTIELRRHINTLNIEVATRKQAEILANESQQKLRTVVHMMPVGISVTDSNGQIIETNRVFQETIGCNEPAGTETINWRDLRGRFFMPDGTILLKEKLPWIIQGFQQSDIDSLEIGMRKKRGGKLIWLNVSSSILSLKGQQVVLTAFTDITYRKRIEELERLRYAELTRLGRINSMAEMSTALAHQMGQPLVSALNYLHGCRLRLEHLDGAGEISGSIGLATDCLEQAGEILRRVRDFVCRHDPEKVPEDINVLIRDVVTFFDFEIHKYKVSVNVILDPTLPVVPLCKIEIQQVLFNLLKNGMESMVDLPESERSLTIGSSMASRAGEVEIYVADNGRGVQRCRSSRMFEPLFTTKPDGIGIGLTICRCIVESHGGKLSFAQTGRRGSRFQFTLPVAPAPGSTLPLTTR